MVTSQNILDNMNYSKAEEQRFKEISSTLFESYSETKTELEGELDVLEQEFGPGSLIFHNIIDRINVIKENLGVLVKDHPSVLLNEQAYRFAALADGFLDSLSDHLINEIMEDQHESN